MTNLREACLEKILLLPLAVFTEDEDCVDSLHASCEMWAVIVIFAKSSGLSSRPERERELASFRLPLFPCEFTEAQCTHSTTTTTTMGFTGQV